MDPDQDVTLQILEKIAMLEGVEPTALTEPLYNTIDPKVVEAIAKTESARLKFEYLGYDVIVDDGSDIEVNPPNSNEC